MKKYISLLIIIVLILSLFTGCSQKKENDDNIDRKEKQETVNNEEELNKRVVDFDFTKQLAYEEYTINGRHISEDFGKPSKIESTNYREDSTEYLEGEFSQTKFYHGFSYQQTGIWASGEHWQWYTITGEDVYGPRNIKIGDSLENTLEKFPKTKDIHFDSNYLDFSEYTSSELISSGRAKLIEDTDSALFLLTNASGEKYLVSYLTYDDVDESGLICVSIKFVGDKANEIILYVY